METEKKFSGAFVLKTALIVMCVSVIVSLVLSMMVFHSFFSEVFSGYSELIALDNLIEKKYYGEYDKEKTEYEACKGLVKGLDDPYSGFYTAKDLEMLMGSISSDYVGIGMSVAMADNGLLIMELSEGGPAQKAGLLPGDVVTHIEGESVIKIGGDEALKIVKTGEVGTDVNFVVDRKGEILEFSVQRTELYDTPVEYDMIKPDVAYIVIKQFNTDAGEKFNEALIEVEKQGAKAIILDMRDNPGGEAVACEEVADALLDEGIMYYSVDKTNEKKTVYTKEGSNKLPLAVLVNEKTASAAELVTGALKDSGRGYIIGETTYGKGVIQGIYTIGENSALRLTIAEYFTPLGYPVQKLGIVPDAVVKPDKDIIMGVLEMDNQLSFAVDYLEKKLGE